MGVGAASDVECKSSHIRYQQVLSTNSNKADIHFSSETTKSSCTTSVLEKEVPNREAASCVPVGSFVLSDIQKGSDGVPYWKGFNAYLPVTVS